jgi:hypothetical protein
MKIGEFTRRARAARLDKKAKHNAALERAIRDLKLSEIPIAQSRPPTFLRSEARRPVLTLFPRA